MIQGSYIRIRFPRIQSRFFYSILCSLIAQLTFTACSSITSSNTKQLDTFASGKMSVIQTIPADGEAGFPINGSIHLIMSETVDAYSDNPANFEIFDESGNRVAGKKIISSRFVVDPRDSTKITSLVSIHFLDRSLMPNSEYVLAWGAVKPGEDAQNYAAYGVQSLTGNRLSAGGIQFKTGTCYLDFIEDAANSMNQNCGSIPNTNLNVVATSPGVELTKENLNKFDKALGDLVNLNLDNSYFTVNPRTPITVRFSEAIAGSDDQDLLGTSGAVPEMPRTPISQFSNMRVFVLDIDTFLGEFTTRAMQVAENPGNFHELFAPFANRLSGSVYTKDGRKTLVFELDPNETYPDASFGQVVVFAVWNMTGIRTYRTLDNNLFIGGFVHIPDFQVQVPLDFAFDFLNLPQRGASQ